VPEGRTTERAFFTHTLKLLTLISQVTAKAQRFVAKHFRHERFGRAVV
jgi:hypothetical protein